MKVMKAAPMPVVRQEFDRLFDRFFSTPLWPLAAPKTFETMWEPSLDFSETPKEYFIRLEAPGMARDDLDVSLDGNLLTLSGKREFHKEAKGEDFLWQEREEGRFFRTLRLPGTVEEGKVEAAYTDGVLTVRLPKLAQPAKSRITVK